MSYPEQRPIAQILWARLRRIMVFSDSHATRFTLALAELLMSYNFLFDHRSLQFQALAKLGDNWVWGTIMVTTTIFQIRFLLKGKYHGKDAAWFAAWDALWWVFLTAAVFSMKDGMPATQLAIAASSAWVFVSSGFTAYGKRGTDYGDASGRIRT